MYRVIYAMQSDIDGNIFYVGQTSNLKHRISYHKCRYKQENRQQRKLYSYIDTIGGFDNVTFITLLEEEFSDIKDVLEKEDFYIKLYNTDKLGNQAINCEINSGNKNSFYGKKHTEETKDKISKNHADMKGANSPLSHKIKCYDLNGNFIAEFGSIREASRELGINHNCIARNVRGECKQAKGFVFFRS